MRTTLACATPAGGNSTIRTPRAPNTGAPGPISRTSGCVYTRRLYTARIYGDTLVGYRELAREIMEKSAITLYAS
jgi:hypothetical protein